MNEHTGSNRGPEIRRRVFRSNRWPTPDPAENSPPENSPTENSPAENSPTETAADNADTGGADSVVFAALPKAAVEAFAGRDGEVPRFVVHLAVVTADLAGAANLACALVRSLAFMPEIDGGETTVSEEDNQGVRHRVFCDRLLPDRRRCAMRHAHAGRCRPTPPLLPPQPQAVTNGGR